MRFDVTHVIQELIKKSRGERYEVEHVAEGNPAQANAATGGGKGGKGGKEGKGGKR